MRGKLIPALLFELGLTATLVGNGTIERTVTRAVDITYEQRHLDTAETRREHEAKIEDAFVRDQQRPAAEKHCLVSIPFLQYEDWMNPELHIQYGREAYSKRAECMQHRM